MYITKKERNASVQQAATTAVVGNVGRQRSVREQYRTDNQLTKPTRIK